MGEYRTVAGLFEFSEAYLTRYRCACSTDPGAVALGRCNLRF